MARMESTVVALRFCSLTLLVTLIVTGYTLDYQQSGNNGYTLTVYDFLPEEFCPSTLYLLIESVPVHPDCNSNPNLDAEAKCHELLSQLIPCSPLTYSSDRFQAK
jgi:hypothetical protein